MSPDKDDTPVNPGGDIGDEDLRRILGEDYGAVIGKEAEAPAATASDPPSGEAGAAAAPEPMVGMSSTEAEAWAGRVQQEMEAGAPGGEPAVAPAAPPAATPTVQPARFAQLEDRAAPRQGSIDLLLDVRLPVSVELGRTEMEVKSILECGPGTVLELTKLAGEPVDIFVNGRMIAQGEVVVVDEHFGVRVTNLLSPRDRVRSLA